MVMMILFCLGKSGKEKNTALCIAMFGKEILFCTNQKKMYQYVAYCCDAGDEENAANAQLSFRGNL